MLSGVVILRLGGGMALEAPRAPLVYIFSKSMYTTEKHNVLNVLRNPPLRGGSGARKPPRKPPELPEPKKQPKTPQNYQK